MERLPPQHSAFPPAPCRVARRSLGVFMFSLHAKARCNFRVRSNANWNVKHVTGVLFAREAAVHGPVHNEMFAR
eukprot:3192897-Pyramimonas_sp.AAC.1